MTFVVTSNCHRCRYTDCVVVCPSDCFHGDAEMLYIDPVECIDCGACVPECPVEAIYADTDMPPEEAKWTELNATRADALPTIAAKEVPLATAEERAQELGFG